MRARAASPDFTAPDGETWRCRAYELPGAPEPTAAPLAGSAAPRQAVGALTAIMLAGALFAGSAASALTDVYMPANNNSPGELAWVALHKKSSQLNMHVKAASGNSQ